MDLRSLKVSDIMISVVIHVLLCKDYAYHGVRKFDVESAGTLAQQLGRPHVVHSLPRHKLMTPWPTTADSQRNSG